MSKRFLILVSLLVVSILAACGETSPPPQSPQPHGTDMPSPTAPPTACPTEIPPTAPPATEAPTEAPTSRPSGPLSSEEARQIIEQRANEVITALQEKDMETLSNYVHPDKGVRFSPYAFVRPEDHVVFSAEEIQGAFEDEPVYHWGTYDGSGEPIDLTFSEYYDEFVYSQDFAAAPQVGYNEVLGQGNTINNAQEVYEDAIIVEYHFPGFDPQYEGMDWESLRLVFQEYQGTWYLVGIIHDQWTI